MPLRYCKTIRRSKFLIYTTDISVSLRSLKPDYESLNPAAYLSLPLLRVRSVREERIKGKSDKPEEGEKESLSSLTIGLGY